MIAGRATWWSPTIGAAIAAGMPWLDIYCPGCRTSRALDIRTLDRHPLGAVSNLILGMRCSWCPGGGPMPRIAGLYAFQPATGVPASVRQAVASARTVYQELPRSSSAPVPASPSDMSNLQFKVLAIEGAHDVLLGMTAKLMLGKALFHAAVAENSKLEINLRQGAHMIEQSRRTDGE